MLDVWIYLFVKYSRDPGNLYPKRWNLVVQLIHAVLLWSSYLPELFLVLFVCSCRFEMSCLAFCVIAFLMPCLVLWKVFWIHEGFNIRFNRWGPINRADMVLTLHFVKFNITPCKAKVTRKIRRIQWKGYKIKYYFPKYNLFHILLLEWLLFITIILWN